MSKSNLWTATFNRSGKTFRTVEAVDGPLAMRRAILDKRSRTDVKSGEEWSFHIFGASKVDPDRDPIYYAFLVEKLADAPAKIRSGMHFASGRVDKAFTKFATSAADDQSSVKPWTSTLPSNAEERAKSLFAPIERDGKDLKSLGKIFARKKAETDNEAVAIAGGIGCMEDLLKRNRADEAFVIEKLQALIQNDFDDGMACAVRVVAARAEKESLLSDGRKYASMRSQAKRIKDKNGALPENLSDEALNKVGQELDTRRAALKSLVADHDGKVDTTLNKLDRALLDFVNPWWGDRQEARSQVDEVCSRVGILNRIRKEREEHLDSLASLVDMYQARMTALIS